MSPFFVFERFISVGGEFMSLVSREAFDEKYMKYSQELMNVSYGYTKSRDDSFDIIQNVFLKY